MARKIVHQLVDDLDGTVLEIGEGETLTFSLDGTAYEIDLTDANAAALRDSLAPYVSAGRRISASQGGSTAGRKRRR
ncbi:MAG: Lsr2 family protein, partial [Microbacterium sp.]